VLAAIAPEACFLATTSQPKETVLQVFYKTIEEF
jgi:hypothetical protein